MRFEGSMAIFFLRGAEKRDQIGRVGFELTRDTGKRSGRTDALCPARESETINSLALRVLMTDSF